MLNSINIDYVDLALIQFVTNKEDYENIIKKGILEYVQQLKKEGKARAVGVSAHNPELLIKMIEKGEFDAIMFPLNFATGILNSTKRLIEICKQKEITVIAIKNLLKGKAFTTKTTNYPAYFCGGKKLKMKLNEPATPAHCMNYAIDSGANTVVFGVKTVEELRSNMESYNSNKGSKNYIYYVNEFKKVILNL